MTDKHDIHWACHEQLQKTGLNTPCCECTGHACRPELENDRHQITAEPTVKESLTVGTSKKNLQDEYLELEIDRVAGEADNEQWLSVPQIKALVALIRRRDQEKKAKLLALVDVPWDKVTWAQDAYWEGVKAENKRIHQVIQTIYQEGS